MLYFFDYMEWKGGSSRFNAFTQAFKSFGKYDRRFCVMPSTDYGSSIDKTILAVEVPAGIIDGTLCIFWLSGIVNNAWYRHPAQLVVSALHAFGTLVFWGDEVLPGYMSWFKGKGFKWTATDGPKSIHWWWSFLGSNAVWVVVPLLSAGARSTQCGPLWRRRCRLRGEHDCALNARLCGFMPILDERS